MAKKDYPKNKPPKHATVRIPIAMSKAIEQFLKTEKAKQMGYIYKTDVVTAAVRDLLKEHGYYEEVEEPTRPGTLVEAHERRR